MKVHRFFVNEELENKDEITIFDSSVIHQARDVLRLSTGYSIILLDGKNKEFHGKIKLLTKTELVFSKEVMKEYPQPTLRNLTLCASVLKKDKFEWVLQKGTEVGVSHFVPVITTRTEKQKLNMDRAIKIIREASEQSERRILPSLVEPVSLKESLESCETPIYVLNQDGEKFDVNQIKEHRNVSLFVGPEGGFDEKDIDMFKKFNAKFISISPNVLRGETACIVGSALFLSDF